MTMILIKEKVSIMKQITKILLTTAAILTLTACNRFGDNNLPKPAALGAFTPTVTLTKLGVRSVGIGDNEQNLRTSIALTQDRLFTTDTRGHIQATQTATGHTLWEQDLPTLISSGIAVSDTLLALVGDNATLYVLDSSNGKILWTAILPNQALAVPTITEDKIFVKTIDEQVVALDRQTGKVVWTFASGAQQLILRFGSAPVVVGDKVVVGTTTGKVYVLNAEDGSIVWEQIIAVPNGINDVQQMVDIDMDPLVEKGVIYVASYQGNLAALELESGVVLWHKEFSSFTGMAIKGDNLYITDANSYLWQINKSDGLVTWKQDKLANRGITAPVLLDKFIIVADKEGYIHVLSDDTGDLAARIQIKKNSILSKPIAQNKSFYVLSQEGWLSAYQING
jgi:outer membrane protein assembly factor BamB